MLGEIRYSVLTLEQFQALYGKGWILMDGSSIVGSDLEKLYDWTAVPDARGLFLRSKNNGRCDGQENPSGDLSLGQFQKDTIISHNHRGIYVDDVSGEWGQDAYKGNFDSHGIQSHPWGSTRSFYTGHSGDKETCPKSITVNIFIKVNFLFSVRKNGREITVNIEFPEVTTKEEFSVSVRENTLIVSGDIELDEKSKRTLVRSLPLPPDAIIKGINADFKHGILEVKIPKANPVVETIISVSDVKGQVNVMSQVE